MTAKTEENNETLRGELEIDWVRNKVIFHHYNHVDFQLPLSPLDVAIVRQLSDTNVRNIVRKVGDTECEK